MQHAYRFTRLTALALGITGALALGQVHASGFQIKENSVTAQGRSFAGSGVAEGDASVVANNPASMTLFEGTTVQVDVTAIDLNAEFNGGGTDAFGQPLSGGNGGNAGDLTPVPAMSLIHKFDNGLTFGAMLSAPFGLKTEYDDGWVGRYSALTSEVETIDLTLSMAYEIVPDRFSFGLGLIYERAEATLSQAVDFGTVVCATPQTAALCTQPNTPYGPQRNDGSAEVVGDDTGFGWIFGINFRPTDKLSIGLTHRSEIDHELRGTVDWTTPAEIEAVFGPSGLFQDGGATAALTTPSVTTVSLQYKVNDRLKLLGDYSETGWESLQEVRIEFDNPADADSVEDFSWEDTVFWSVGAEYKLSDRFTLRGGYAYDETPTSLDTRTPRLPDENRRWYSVGLTWNVSDSLDISAAYSRIEPDSPQIDRVDSQGHTLVGEYESDVNLFGISAQYRF